MGKIAISNSFFIRLTFLLVVLLITTACSSIYSVAITNSTDEAIQFRGQFVSKSNAINNLDFTLKPGADDLWMYEIGYFEDKILDKGLKRIILTNEKNCRVVLERETLEKIAIKNGPWEINIDNKIMDCNKK